MNTDQKLNNSDSSNYFWRDRGEREFIYILIVSLVIIGTILWFLFSLTGNRIAQAGLTYIGEKSVASTQYLADYLSDISLGKNQSIFQVEADDHDQQSFKQENSQGIKILSFADIEPNQLRPSLIEKNISLDKITNSLY